MLICNVLLQQQLLHHPFALSGSYSNIVEESKFATDQYVMCHLIIFADCCTKIVLLKYMCNVES